MLSNALGVFAGLAVGGGARTRNSNSIGSRSFFCIGMAFFLPFSHAGPIRVSAYRPPPRKLQRKPLGEKLSRLEWIGYGLLPSGLSLFCLGLSFLSQYGRVDPQVSFPFGIGLTLEETLGVMSTNSKRTV